MRLRDLLRKLRFRSVQAGDDQRSIDNVDGMTTMSGSQALEVANVAPTPAPPNWVPSQQDDRPRH